MFGFNPYLALAGVLALAAAAGGGFVKGEQHANARRDQAQLHQLTAAIAERDQNQKIIDALEAAAGQREQLRQTNVREIDREIPEVVTRDRIVYDRTCIDADGVRLLDRAETAANGASSVDPGAAAGRSIQAAGDAAHR